MSGLEKKFATKSKIVNYITNRESTSKVEISKELNLSMPTVLSNVKDLLEKGIIIETGEYESTGGRKAKSIGINPSYRYAMGIVITANHLGMVLVNLKYEIVKSERIRLKFVPDMSYCSQVADFAAEFLDNMNDAEQKEKLLGVGISIPGIINQEQKLVIKSHALKLENYSLSFLEQAFSVSVYFVNDANAAMMAEDMNTYQNAIYLSLNQTLGGAFCIGGKLFSGENQKAGEFGHMILVPQGRKCYCGKSGCADAYCAAGALVGESKDSVEQFMQLLQNNDEKAEKKWEEYLDYLAILISNLRMAYDMDIILGGEMGGYLSDYMIPLGEKVMKYNGFDHDLRYLKNCSYKKEASAVGAAFAGDLAVTTTSGPGVCLKSEAMNLAVIAELPLVVVNVQRGGPSTGMPTKSEQTDLLQALYGRNGESPMPVIAATSPTNCFDAAYMAAKIALEHMTPVVLLTDAFIANGSAAWKLPNMDEYPAINPPYVTPDMIGTWTPFQRNEKTGVRYWAVPGTEGFMHRIGGLEKSSETGVISTEPENHQKMTLLRQAKVDKIADSIPEQEVQGDADADLLVVGWGGTYGHLYSAVEHMRKNGKKVALAHFQYINPLPKNTAEILKKYKKIVVAEQNLGQFAGYLRMKVPGLNISQFNQVKGQPFVTRELVEAFTKLLEE